MRKKAAAVLISLTILAIIITLGRVFSISSIEERYDEEPLFVEAGTIALVSGIKLDSNILAINKNRAIKNVEMAYMDNSVAVIGIERKFPNKVIIYCKERLPIMKLAIKNSSNYALADIDFQLNRIVTKEEADKLNLISVEGIEIENSFNLNSLAKIRTQLYSYVDNGTPIKVLPRLIESVIVSEEGVEVGIRG